MRFSGSTEATTTTAAPVSRVIKGPQKSGKDRSSIPLPPGYVDRAAQRRSGLETSSTFNIFETEITPATTIVNNSNDLMKIKLNFLEETAGLEGFPTCSQIQTERLMRLVFGVTSADADNEDVNKHHLTDFKDNEAFLQFKSIEESKTLPFDPFNRPRKVFRASSASKDINSESGDDNFVLERVKEAVKRLELASAKHQKYLETLNQKSENNFVNDDIFPEVGVFDEKAFLEKAINNNNKTTDGVSVKAAKVKNRLFASKSAPKTIEKEVDIFELIAQKSLDDENNKNSFEETDGGGLFGFSSILPKLSRLENEINSKGSENKLTGAYASILSDDEGKDDNSVKKSDNGPDDEDDYLYPGYLENDPTIFDSDEETIDNEKMPKNKRKLARKEDKEAAKVEKLVKNKFGVDLSK